MVCMGKSSWYIAYCPLCGRCPLFGVSAKRGSTVQTKAHHLSPAKEGLIVGQTCLHMNVQRVTLLTFEVRKLKVVEVMWKIVSQHLSLHPRYIVMATHPAPQELFHGRDEHRVVVQCVWFQTA